MDTMRSRVKGWWWLDHDRVWRWTWLGGWARVRASRARRAELEVRLAERGVVGGRWR